MGTSMSCDMNQLCNHCSNKIALHFDIPAQVLTFCTEMGKYSEISFTLVGVAPPHFLVDYSFCI